MIFYVQSSRCTSSTWSVSLSHSPVFCRLCSKGMLRRYVCRYLNFLYLLFFSFRHWYGSHNFQFTFNKCLLIIYSISIILLYGDLITCLWLPGCTFWRAEILAGFSSLVTFIYITYFFSIWSLLYGLTLDYNTLYISGSKYIVYDHYISLIVYSFLPNSVLPQIQLWGPE